MAITNLTLLSPESQEYISSILANNLGKSKQVSISLSKAMSDLLPMPKEQVEDPTTYFRNNHLIPVLQILDNINEIVLIDKTYIGELLYSFYNFRYQNLYPDEFIFTNNKETAVLDLFKITKFFDENTLKEIKDDPLLITKSVNRFKNIIKELNKNKEFIYFNMVKENQG